MASGRLGVMMVASGRSLSFKASTASAASSRLPPLATMTGSSTTKRGLRRTSASATVSICSTVPPQTAARPAAAMEQATPPSP